MCTYNTYGVHTIDMILVVVTVFKYLRYDIICVSIHNCSRIVVILLNTWCVRTARSGRVRLVRDSLQHGRTENKWKYTSLLLRNWNWIYIWSKMDKICKAVVFGQPTKPYFLTSTLREMRVYSKDECMVTVDMARE